MFITRHDGFTSREVGAKWDVRSDLALTAAAFELERTNTSAPDPSDPSRVVQTGEQRSRGIELGASGSVTAAWQIAGGVSWQKAEIKSATTAARAGARVPLVPAHSASLWNRVQVHPRLGLGVGLLHQADVWAAIDNTVTLPGFTRVDGAAFLNVHPRVRAQVNVENLFDEAYYLNAHSNTNITPGSPRAVRVALTTHF